ncbi:YT521-B-like domain-containing protein [Achaetomium macrosporum]|uniref:YT521-B-like domain-containing protein n=1 Tax=Achaetomium macrosporum TaxID=79813 RepID=A0AAN7CGS2_9PEZI|nr:YT521-B-like domain-containing protein [Achaetomium macrosporum]
MSGTSQTTRIGLDARAAELKEKLLRSRGQSQPRANSVQASPNAAKSGINVAVVTPGPLNKSEPGAPAPDQAKPAQSVPHTDPQPPASTSSPHDASEIRDLISSLFAEIPDADNDGPSPSNNAQKVAKEQMPEEGEGTTSESPLATPASRTSDPQSAAACDRRRGSTRADTDPAPVRKSPEKREVTRSEGAELKRTDPKSPLATPVSRSSDARSTATFDRRRESTRTEPDPTPVRQSAQDPPRRDRGSKSHTAASRSVIQGADSAEAPTTGRNSTGISQAVTGDKNLDQGRSKRPEASRRVDEPALSDEAFTRLLNKVPDLKDWLEMTHYHDVETRTRKLDRFRRAKVLAAEKRRIEEEERKLMEEEALEMGLPPSSVVQLTGVAKNTPVAPDSDTNNSLPTPVALYQDPPHARPDKRAREENSPPDVRQAKVPRSGAPPGSSSDIDSRTRHPSPPGKAMQPPRSPGRGSPPSRLPRPPSPGRHEYRRPREPSPYRQARPGPRPGTDNHGSHEDYPQRHDRRGSYRTYPVPVDLGRKGDTRYFIVKSFTEENVRRCMEDGLWTTQVQNEAIFAEAFKKCKNVILFFSVNKSRAFQGYARMASAPSPDTPSPKWVKGLNWDTSHPFRVQWLSKTSVEFFRIGHLKNSYNEGMSVLVGKDGQEIEEQCGADLLREMEAIALRQGEGDREDGYQSRRASGSWGNGRGRYSEGYGYGYKG